MLGSELVCSWTSCFFHGFPLLVFSSSKGFTKYSSYKYFYILTPLILATSRAYPLKIIAFIGVIVLYEIQIYFIQFICMYCMYNTYNMYFLTKSENQETWVLILSVNIFVSFFIINNIVSKIHGFTAGASHIVFTR